jgi:hypothetical protein
MAGTIVADTLQAASTSTLVLKNGVANTPPTIQDSAGTQIGTFCRAWVNFDGTGTVAIRSSFNVSSITDTGTGLYTVNFTTAMPDANYSVSGAFMRSGAGALDPLPFIVANGAAFGDTFLTSSLKIICSNYVSTRFDPLSASVSIFR